MTLPDPVPPRPPHEHWFWRLVAKIIKVAIERKSEALWMAIATAVTNAFHFLVEWWQSSALTTYWQAYIDGLRHCWS